MYYAMVCYESKKQVVKNFRCSKWTCLNHVQRMLKYYFKKKLISESIHTLQ